MALVLGPELDVFLRGIGEDLKGKTILEEPYVDKKTIVRAVSEQNKVILALQTQVLQMQEMEKAMQLKMSMMQDKLTHFEKYTEKVDVIEGILREKIPVVDKLDEKVKQQQNNLQNLSKEVKDNVQDVATFKDEARDSFSEVRKGIECLSEDVELLPDTIIISSRQVTHSVNDEKEFYNKGNKHHHGNDILADIIAQQEQHALIQDEKIGRIDEKIDDHVVGQCVCNNEMKKDIHTLVDWKEAQSSVDLKSMKRHIDRLQMEIQNHNVIMSNKMSKDDVEQKLEHQFSQIVDHLQTALSSIENEEADFKCITDSLSKMCESLRESKAEKSELTALRKQFITNQVGGNRSSMAGSTLDNAGIRKILSKYATKDEVLKLLDVCDDLDSSPVVGKIHSKIDNLRNMVLRLESVMSKNVLKLADTSTADFEERRNPEDSRPLMEKRPKSYNQNDTTAKKSRFSMIQEGSSEDCVDNKKRIEDHLNISGIHSSGDQKSNGGEDLQFPSSNVLQGVFLNKVNQDNLDGSCSRTFSGKKSQRPLSAPLRKNEVQQFDLEKKQSLPAILTSTSKTMRPRSNKKLKNFVNNTGQRIHKGSYQVMSTPLEFGNSSDHFLSSLSSTEQCQHVSRERHFKKKKVGYLIRTSIE